MNPELQSVVDRLELIERQSRNWKWIAMLAVALAALSLALPLAGRAVAPEGRARYSVIEANRILLRDLNGSIAGGLESRPDGSLRLVLGGRTTSSAHLVVPRVGPPQFTLRAPDGRVQVGLTGSERPAAWLSADGRNALVALGTAEGDGGEIWVRDAGGRPRFHAP